MKRIQFIVLFFLIFVNSAFAAVSVISYGGAQTVSGSSFLVERGKDSCLVDCGMFMGEVSSDKNFEMPAELINAGALILTHAHTDHIGRVPLLIASGFKGKIYSTQATKYLALEFFRQGTGFEFIKREWFWFPENGKRSYTIHWRFECMNSLKQVKLLQKPMLLKEVRETYGMNFYLCKKCLKYETAEIEKLFITVKYNEEVTLFKDFKFKLINAGHIPGSASVFFEIEGKKILFSGDLGSGFSRLNAKAENPPKADYVFVESTNALIDESTEQSGFMIFRKDLMKALSEKKIVWIPALSFNRTQKVLYELKLMQDEKILDKNVPIYSVSPSANRINAIYEKEIKKEKAGWFAKEIYERGTLLPKNLKKSVSSFDKAMIILSSSGDMDAGMSKKLAGQLLTRDDVFIMIVNYVDPGSLAGNLIERNSFENKKVDIKRYHIFSGHPDIKGISAWLSSQDINSNIYLIHGEKESLMKMENILKRKYRNVFIAKIKERIIIK
ncbi:MAG: MBL fold metallo-hydrolase [Elusimicrobiota bacterium]|jgi:metallo-beta-lactamase family protein|nr:MBL fold metallo-hydrolase [Elusimicrobiota bacterium]